MFSQSLPLFKFSKHFMLKLGYSFSMVLKRGDTVVGGGEIVNGLILANPIYILKLSVIIWGSWF